MQQGPGMLYGCLLSDVMKYTLGAYCALVGGVLLSCIILHVLLYDASSH